MLKLTLTILLVINISAAMLDIGKMEKPSLDTSMIDKINKDKLIMMKKTRFQSEINNYTAELQSISDKYNLNQDTITPEEFKDYISQTDLPSDLSPLIIKAYEKTNYGDLATMSRMAAAPLLKQTQKIMPYSDYITKLTKKNLQQIKFQASRSTKPILPATLYDQSFNQQSFSPQIWQSNSKIMSQKSNSIIEGTRLLKKWNWKKILKITILVIKIIILLL